MSALKKIIAGEEDATNFGFCWPNQQMIIDQAIDECREITEAINARSPSGKIQEEIGDLLHAAISLCIFLGFNLEETLDKTYTKFAHRMIELKKLAKELGFSNLNEESIEFKLKLWHQAKDITDNKYNKYDKHPL